MARQLVSVDGEEGYTLRTGEGHLALRKGDHHVRIAYAEVSSVSWAKRHRYGRLLLWLGIILLLAVGTGVILILLYYLSAYDALVIAAGGRDFALNGDRAVLEDLQRRIRTGRAGLDKEEE